MQKLVLTAAISMLALAACNSKEKEPATSGETNSGVSSAQIINADNSSWLSYGRTYDEQRFSPLATVNADNVANLGLAWSYDLDSSRGIEATPIVHDGMMYVTSTYNVVHAMNARTGAPVWTWEPEIDMVQASNACCDIVNRGVALWGDTIFTATIDGRLVALNAKTGDVIWDKLTIDKSKPYTITGAPRVVKGKVIIGNGGAELGVRGYISAYDAETGDMDWRFYTVPGNPEDGFENDTMAMAAETWTGEWWTAGGGGTAWDAMAYDPDLDLLYFGVGNGSPWNQSIRSPDGGDNLFLSSMVAVRPDTGEYVWHYQTTPGETWDYTATQHLMLADLEIDGKTRKVIMQAPKNGFFYVIDRESGEFISANNFVPVNWATHIDEETGRPVEIEAARYYGKEPYLQLPGPLGAHNWHPMSYSQDTGLVYIPAQEAPWVYGDRANYKHTPGTWNTGTDFSYALLPTDRATFKALKSMVKGRLLAWDPVKQEEAWTFEHNGPWNGGILSTGGNLVFQGTADAHFAAYNAKTGDQLWKYFTQSGIGAAPITYELDGVQYVAVASGYGGSFVLGFGAVLPSGSDFNSGRVLVFKLGADGSLPAPLDAAMPEFDLPEPVEISDELLAKGVTAYANSCAVCHGDHAFASGLTPNLRYSGVTADAETWQMVVREGLLAENGMPNFGKVYDAETAEAIRAYVIGEAHSGRDQEFYKTIDE
ncbi:MAG: PQQ-dependent dehydrogenase, methanol/ethanol family [Hellea sp.]|nr:PQQ-dependent dehydrogenase, methanol/ethanol family [Hellea sp.]